MDFVVFCEGFNHTQNYKNINKNHKNKTPYLQFPFFFAPLISGSVVPRLAFGTLLLIFFEKKHIFYKYRHIKHMSFPKNIVSFE